MNKLLLAAAAALTVGIPAGAGAAVTINIVQSGANVVATGTGTLSLTGATRIDPPSYTVPYIEADRAAIFSGGADQAQLADYQGFTALPAGFGTSMTAFTPTSTSGTIFGITKSVAGTGAPALAVLSSFTSGSSVQFTMTWSAQTLAGLGLNIGSYSYLLPNDRVTINIGAVGGAVPEVASWAMMIAGLGAVGAALRRRQRASDAAFDARIRRIAAGEVD